MARNKKSLLSIISGFIFNKKGEGITSVRDMYNQEAAGNCGCGPKCDCDEGFYNFDRDSKEQYVIYVEGGELFAKLGDNAPVLIATLT